MVLLSILALGMLSLSSISLRSSSRNDEMSEARSNARMALMMAIGELQRYTGPDTRITAPANIIDPAANAPHLTGVWKSWEGTNHDLATGRPISPDYDVKTIEESAQTLDGSDGRFLTWLVSGAQPGIAPTEQGNRPADLVFTEDNVDPANTIALLSDKSLGSNPGQVHVTPLPVKDENNITTGTYAWWVSPENQKARLAQPHKARTEGVAGWSDMAKSYAIPDPEPFGLDILVDNPESYIPVPADQQLASKAISLDTTELLVANNPQKPQESFHELSTTAIGLLTNTATGGWRKDMSILTEKWNDPDLITNPTKPNPVSPIYSKYPGARLPLFRYLPGTGNTSLVPKPTTTSYDIAQSNLYPWSEYRLFPDTNKTPLTYNTAASSWQSLVNFATKYKEINFDQATQTASAPIGWSNTSINSKGDSVGDGQYYGKYHDFEFNPVLARAQYLIQTKSHIRPDRQTSADASNHYRMNMRIIPIYTLWNPYNVEIVHSYKNNGPSFEPGYWSHQDKDFAISVMRSLPLALRITNKDAPPANDPPFKIVIPGTNSTIDKNGTVYQTFRDDELGENRTAERNYGEYMYAAGSSNWRLDTYLPIEFSLKPGEVKQFSIAFEPKVQGLDQGNATVQTRLDARLKEGFWRADNLGFPIQFEKNFDPTKSKTFRGLLTVPSSRGGNELHAGDRLNFEARTDRYTKIFANKPPSAGLLLGVGLPHWYSPSNTLAKVESGGIPDHGARYIKSTMTTGSPMSWAEDYWPSFEFDDFPSYTAAELDTTLWNDLISVSFGPRLSFGSSSTDSQNKSTKGVVQSSPFAQDSFGTSDLISANHPANGAYDIVYHVIGDEESNILPTDGIPGYIATGFDDVLGLSRLIMTEVPLRPMASLVELQNWNLRGNNPFPPHQSNLIGNSDATPMIERDSVLAGEPMEADPSLNLQHDDAYCANHLLFDDWFFSSIAPQPTDFGKTISKDIETVYSEYLQGVLQLTNRAYKPIAEDRSLSVEDAGALVDEIVNSPGGDGWLKVASRFEVDGMFNVNSTSITAWRALLGSARARNVAHHTPDGIDDTGPHDYVVSRHSVAGDVKAGEDSVMAVGIEGGSEYAGFRTLTDQQLDELAEKIVDQVRARGPFLSLSEFINRKLTSDPSEQEFALAGALQAALNNLSDDNDPMAILSDKNTLSRPTMKPVDLGSDPYPGGFKEASDGVNTYGFPGWIRQADILRPIAPVLSARDDTFTIRAYGDKTDAEGNIIAQAWCEATVQRSREFVDPTDDAAVESPSRETNRSFGRIYRIKHFRWLSKDEV